MPFGTDLGLAQAERFVRPPFHLTQHVRLHIVVITDKSSSAHARGDAMGSPACLVVPQPVLREPMPLM
jgi:hypothetical protein